MRFFAAVGFVLVLLVGAVVVVAAHASGSLAIGAIIGGIGGTVFAAYEHHQEARRRARTGR